MKQKTSLILISAILSISVFAQVMASSSPTEIPFNLTVNGETHELTLSKLGVSASESDEVDTIASIFSWFGQASLLDGLLAKETNYDFSWSELRSEDLVRNTWKLDRPKNARFVQTDGSLSIEAESEGVDFDIESLLIEITSDYPNLDDYELEITESELTSAEDLIAHFGQVNDLLENGLTVSTTDVDYQFPSQLKDIVMTREGGEVKMKLNKPYMDYVVATLDELTYSDVSNITIWEASDGVGKANMEGQIKNGQKLDSELTEKMIAGAIASGESEATGVLDLQIGSVVNESGKDLGDMELLSSGVSDFSTSPYGRDFNVRKALDQHYNGIVIPAGETFHFNEFLGPVTYSAGWEGSLAIFGGSNLVTVPGGGICQVSTTVYRAALNAGLDIEEQRNHSLYIHYYEAYGDGQDSTIYPGSQDLVFKNNTDGPILIEAYAEDTTAIVNFYGTDDGRKVELFGPYTQSNQNDAVIAGTGGLGYNQIAWQQVTTWADGSIEDDWRISSYRGGVTQY
jgi:vancomycin resistance protein YoaR